MKILCEKNPFFFPLIRLRKNRMASCNLCQWLANENKEKFSLPWDIPCGECNICRLNRRTSFKCLFVVESSFFQGKEIGSNIDINNRYKIFSVVQAAKTLLRSRELVPEADLLLKVFAENSRYITTCVKEVLECKNLPREKTCSNLNSFGTNSFKNIWHSLLEKEKCDAFSKCMTKVSEETSRTIIDEEEIFEFVESLESFRLYVEEILASKYWFDHIVTEDFEHWQDGQLLELGAALCLLYVFIIVVGITGNKTYFKSYYNHIDTPGSEGLWKFNQSRKENSGVIEKFFPHTKISNIKIIRNPDSLAKPEDSIEPTKTWLNFTISELLFIGRYQKYSRKMSQTIWVVDGELMTPDSVETAAKTVLDNYCISAGNTKFMAAGREDADVRMMGDGRPFAIVLRDVRKSPLCVAEFGEDKFLNDFSSTNKETVQSRDLKSLYYRNNMNLEGNCHDKTAQFSHKLIQEIDAERAAVFPYLALQVNPEVNATKLLHKASEDKRKTYQALIHSTQPFLDDAINIFNAKHRNEPTFIEQKTPLRVLHRRTADTRQKQIFCLTLEKLDVHWALMTIDTQAGTYIKEFVSSDQGRTKQSLEDLYVGALVEKASDYLTTDLAGVFEESFFELKIEGKTIKMEDKDKALSQSKKLLFRVLRENCQMEVVLLDVVGVSNL